jgi:hypothetical protein
MNGALFLLPFVLIATLGLSQDSYAAESIIGINYFDVTNPDGSHTWSTHHEYILDNGIYVPYVQNGLTVNSAIGDVTLNQDGSYTWNGKFTDKIVGKYADITNLNLWTYPNGLNNDVPNVSFSNGEFHSNKIQTGVANMDYKYVFKDGKWKTELVVTNLSSLTTKVFGFDQIIDLNTDTVKIDDVIYNIDDFDGTVLNKLFLDYNQGKVLDLMNGVNFDFDLGYENLHSVTIHDTGVNSSQLVLDYRTNAILLPGETLVIDPTYDQASSASGRTIVNSHGGSACTDSPTYGIQDTTVNMFLRNNQCQLPYISFDTSGITDTVTEVTSATIDLTNGNTGGTLSYDCVLVELETEPVDVNSNHYAEAWSGTEITNAFSECKTASTNDLISFNSAGLSDLLTKLNSKDFYALTMIYDGGDSVLESSTRYATGIVMSLEIVYVTTTPPDAITDLTYTNLDGDSLDLIWTAPGLNGGNITNYMVNSTTPWSSSTNFLANTTSLFYNVTGLNWGTDYSFSASVLTEGGYNFTGNVLNITTTSPLYTGVAPTSLTVNDGNHSVNTILNLEWVADLMDNINGFRIFFETPIGNGFTTLTANTTTTTLYYNDTGLSPGIFYNYKVAAMNGTGISENSTAYAQTPHKLADLITDLTITPNSLLQFLGSWSAPTLYGTLNGYQVNYTTPAGDPQTIYTSTEPTTSSTISGLNPTVEYSFRVAANTYHGINATGGNIANATASSEIAVGDLDFDAGDNPDVNPIWYENYVVDSTTNNVQVRYDSALTVDCTITERIANNVSTYNGLAETAAVGYVYHNFTVTNAGNDVLDWDCYDQTDSTINGQYALSQDQSAIGVGNIPLFSLMGNFTGGLYGTEGTFAGIDLITLFIVIISMLGFNKKNPALGVGVMATLLGAAWYYGLIPWTSGVLGALAVVLVLAIGQGIKRD